MIGRLSLSYVMGLLNLEHSSTQATLFSLIYGAEAISIEVMVPSSHLALASRLSNSSEHIYDIEVLEEKRQSIEDKWLSTRSKLGEPILYV